MRRADRLFRIVGLVRGRRLTTAQWLAERLEVALRTVYRDIAELQAQGVPIEGQAGVGYRLRPGFDLPPLMLTGGEAKALVACVRLAQPRLDPQLSNDADSALTNLLAVLPPAARAAADSLAVFAPAGGPDASTRERLARLREAIEARRIVGLDYLDLEGAKTRRRVRPLAVLYWDAVWTLAAWCELRRDFRNFRVDRIAELDVLAETFRDEPGRTLADLVRAVSGQKR
jgi:predicted DNA-binding transcriptional regulator YafY